MTSEAYRIDGEVVPPQVFYATACDPRRSVVVEACAGAGKTWMLVSRVLRALLDGARPQEILAITFTRKAAGEMRERLSQWLADWASPRCDAAARIHALRERGLDAHEAAAAEAALAELHERLLATGESVQIHTFHAWFSQLMRTAPLELLSELGLQPAMDLVEDTTDLEEELLRVFHAALLREPALREDYAALVRSRGRAQVRKWLSAALDKRIEIERAHLAATLEPSVPAVLCEVGDHPACVLETAAWRQTLSALAQVLRAAGGKQQCEAAQRLEAAVAAPEGVQVLATARKALFTKDDNPAKQRALKLGGVAGLDDVQERIEAISRLACDHEAHVEHLRMARLSRLLLSEYAALKRQRGLADMADLETCALHVLRDAELSAWVQEQIDMRVRHLLVDEFQDTSPLQWQALHAWLSAYAGAGGGPSGQRPPSLFIVGDPKQSIYRFRRAEPRVFDAAREFVCAGLGGAALACDHTRRNVPEVLEAVNAVFAAARDRGEFPGFRTHTTQAAALRQPAVFGLPAIERPPAAPRTAKGASAVLEWRDSLTVPREEAEAVVREHEARVVAAGIRELIDGGAAKPGDIMVLSRKRASLRIVAEALQALHLPFVAAEDLPLMEAPQARDLVALLDALASPRHRLSLAHALRSPVFGVSDAGLAWLAERAAAVDRDWMELLVSPPPGVSLPPELQPAQRLLGSWRRAAATLPPHDLLDRIVAEGEVHARVAAAVPPERRRGALAAIDAVIGLALELDGGRYASPYSFVRALRRRALKAPGPADPEAVQLLTVHGAKGLEADVVFLMDCRPERQNGGTATLLVDWPVESPAPRRCAFVASEARVHSSLAGLMRNEEEARQREELNGLYVAMTRARKRLVFSHTPPWNEGPSPSWWDRVCAAATPWQPAPAASAEAGPRPIVVPALPAYEAAPTAAAGVPASDNAATRLGRAVHRLLEWALVDPGQGIASNWLTQAALEFGLTPGQVEDAERFALAMLRNPRCASLLHGPDVAWAGNEVSIAVEGAVRRIDRLVRTRGGQWWVLDYKLSSAPQEDPRNLDQLRAYRKAVAALQPGAVVRAAFVTGTGEVAEIE
jgi:ATP-dependent helicase/nuclease subunit A